MRSGTLAFLAGILLFNQLPDLPGVLLYYTALAGSILIFIRKARWLGFLCAGFCWMHWHAVGILTHRLPESVAGQDVVVIGQIVTVPEKTAERLRFEFNVRELLFQDKKIPFHGRVRLSWYYRDEPLTVGDEWQLRVRLKPPHGLMNPGGFDYERWLFRKHINATGYVRAKSEQILITRHPWQHPVDRARQHIKNTLSEYFSDNQYKGILQALAVGIRDDIPQAQWHVLTATGTNHLMAISGLHIGLVAGLAWFATRRLWAFSGRLVLWSPSTRAGSVSAMIAAIVYAALAGFSVPTQRALIMLLVILLFKWFYRRIFPAHVLSWALIAVLVFDPLSAMEPGFWLSFTAVAVIFYGMNRRINRQQSGFKKWWWQWGRVQWLVAVGLLPFMLILFGQFSVYSAFANLVAVPWMSLAVIPLTLAGTLLGLIFPSVGMFILKLATELLSWLWIYLQWLSELPGVLWLQVNPPVWTIAAGISGILLLLAPKGIPGRWLGLFWCLPMLLWMPEKPQSGEAWVTLLDVGQGLSAVVQTQHHSLVFDTGPGRNDFDTGDAVVVPFLRQGGIKKVDMLMLSHGDNDHSGGAASILSSVSVARVVGSEILNTLPVDQEKCHEGQGWDWDGVHFQLLNPSLQTPHKGNNNSCVLRVEAGGKSVLLTGDIGTGGTSHGEGLWQRTELQCNGGAPSWQHYLIKRGLCQYCCPRVCPVCNRISKPIRVSKGNGGRSLC